MSGLEILVALVMLVGLIGTVIPYFPGILLVLAAALVWALLGEGGATAWATFAVLAVVGIAGLGLSTWLPVRATAGEGAPRWVLAVGLLGVVVGFFVIPVVGALIGGPLAVLLAELYRVRDPERAWKLTVRAIKGVGLGILVEFLAALAMISIWAVVVLVD